MIIKIKKLDVDAGATIEVVERDGQELILKTSSADEVLIEKAFVRALDDNHIPHLALYEDSDLAPNQLLLEYIEDSPTIGKTETPELFEKWGAVVRRMHDVKSRAALKILENGAFENIDWKTFLNERFTQAVDKQMKLGLLSRDQINAVGNIVSKLALMEPSEYSLIHGDMHSNNVIVRNGEAVLFDKGHFILYGDRFYDLAIFAIGFLYAGEESDKSLAAAFMKGYGEDFVKLHTLQLELNVLLRAFERHGNKFEPQTGEIITSFIERYK